MWPYRWICVDANEGGRMGQPRRQLHSVALGTLSFRLSTLHARHFFEHGTDRGGVMVGMARRHGGVIERARGGKHRRGAAERLREFADHSHILLPEAYLHSGLVIA